MVPTGRQAIGVPGGRGPLLYVCSLLRRAEPLDPDGAEKSLCQAFRREGMRPYGFPGFTG